MPRRYTKRKSTRRSGPRYKKRTLYRASRDYVGGMYNGRILPRSYRVHNFCQKHNFATITAVGNSVTNTYAWQFTLGDLTQASNLGALYDQYRLNRITLRIIERQNVESMVEGRLNNNVGLPYAYWLIDRDDATAPTSMEVTREYAKSRFFAFTPEHRVLRISFKPNTLTQKYDTGISTGYSIKYNEWMDMAQTDTKYYGVKLAIWQPDAGAGNYLFDVEATYYFQCRDLR